MSESHDLRTARERVQRVFRYLQEMHRVRTPPIVQLDDREWRLKLEDLPDSRHIRRGYEPSAESPSSPEGELATGGPFVIKVGRPKETECPEPSVVIKNWLKSGWDQVDADPASIVKKSRKSSSGKVESFSDSEDRVEALADWSSAKRAWERAERQAMMSPWSWVVR